MAYARADLDGGRRVGRKMRAVNIELLDRVWDPTDPLSPHVAIVGDGDGVTLALVGPVGPPILLDSKAWRRGSKVPLEMARAIYTWGQECVEYVKRGSEEDQIAELKARVQELKAEIDGSTDEAVGLTDVLEELILNVQALERQLAGKNPDITAVRAGLRRCLSSAEKRVARQMGAFEVNRIVEGGEDAILRDAAEVAERDELRTNQQHLVRVLFNLCIALEGRERKGKVMPLEKATELAMEVLDHVHHDGLGKTLGEIVRALNPDEIAKAFEGR